MNYSEAFAILMLEVKKDENAIKVAYRKLLSQNNPEENPEGFKLLRKAYEVALEYARSTDKEEEIVTVDFSNPLSVWMKTVVEVYKNLSRRFNVDEWRKILEDDVCNSLDYYEDAKRTLFEFLRDYPRVPKEVYILLNEKYNFVEQQNNLKEYLPIECVDFMVRMVTEEDYKDVCDVKYLECADDADYDRFRSMIYQVQTIVYDKEDDMDKVPLMLKQIDALNISHPLYDSLKARYYAEVGDVDKANEILEKLDSIEALKEDFYMKVIIADTMILTGKKERAREILEYFSKKEYMYKCEELLKRRTKYEYDNTSYNMLYAKLCEQEQCFDEAIEEYKKVIEESGDAEDIEYNMASCYARMYDYKNALESIKKVEELGKDSDFNDMNLAHLYEKLGNCMKNVAYINKSITHFIKQRKKNYKQDERYLNYKIAENYNKLGNYVSAKKYVSEIILDGVDYSITSLKAKIAFYQKDYESAIIMSDIALRDYFVTYAETLGVHWQLAYDLTEIQALSFVRINRVYKALELWEDVPGAFKELEVFEKFRIFEDAVKSQIQICLDEKMYDEAEKIINAKQKYLSRDRYYYEVIRLNLLRANTKKEYKKVFDMAKKIGKEIDAEFIKYITAVAALLGEDDINIACSYFDKLFADRTLNTLWNVNNFLVEYICILDLIGEENKKQYYINKFNECLTTTYIEEEKTTRIDKFLSEPRNQFYNLCMVMQLWCASGDSDCLKMAGKYIQRLEKMREDPYSYRGGVTQRTEALAIYYEKIGEIEKAEELYEKLIEVDDENSYYALFRRKWKNKSVDAEKDQSKSNKTSLFTGLKDALRDEFK